MTPEMQQDPRLLEEASRKFVNINRFRKKGTGRYLDAPTEVAQPTDGFAAQADYFGEGARRLAALAGGGAQNLLPAQAVGAGVEAAMAPFGNAYDDEQARVAQLLEAGQTPAQPAQPSPAVATSAIPQTQPTTDQLQSTVPPIQPAQAGVSPPAQTADYLALARELFPQMFPQEVQPASAITPYQPSASPEAPATASPGVDLNSLLSMLAPSIQPTAPQPEFTPPAEHFLTRLGSLFTNMSRGIRGEELDFFGPERQREALQTQKAARLSAQAGASRAEMENQVFPAAAQADVLSKRLGNMSAGLDVVNAPDRMALVNEAMRLQNESMRRALTPQEIQQFELIKMFLGNAMQQGNMRLAQSLQPSPGQQFAVNQPGVFQPQQLEQILGLPSGSINPELLARTLRSDPMALMQVLEQLNAQGLGINVPR